MKKRFMLMKGMAFSVAMAMLAGAIFSNALSTTANAGENSSSPSVNVYATVEQLQNSNNFALSGDYSGVAKKVAFGFDGSGNTQYWYIAGNDSVNHGLVLISSLPLGSNQAFYIGDEDVNTKENNITYNEAWNCVYENDNRPTEVYPNHYGSSSIRGVLNDMAEDENYFSEAEQAFLKYTTVYTEDTLNGSVYSTTDKLYLAHGNIEDQTCIIAGSNLSSDINSGLKIDVVGDSPYGVSYDWSHYGAYFRLRTSNPDADNDGIPDASDNEVNYIVNGVNVCPIHSFAGSSVLCATTYNGIGQFTTGSVEYKNPIVPVFNMNMEKVLFASAVPIVSGGYGSISSDDAFIMRMDGKTKLSDFTVTYTSDSVKFSTISDKTVTLVVQGKDGLNDWYYTASVDENALFTASELQLALSLNAIPDFENCKIWIETTEDNVTYAVKAEEEKAIEPTTTSQVPIYDIRVNNVNGGSVKTELIETERGTVVRLSPISMKDFEFKEWQIIRGDVVIENDSFLMPEEEVVIMAIFERVTIADEGKTTTEKLTWENNGMDNDIDDVVNTRDTSTIEAIIILLAVAAVTVIGCVIIDIKKSQE